MTSEEKLVAQAAKELLESSPAVDLLAQIALGTDQEDLKLPAVVVSASFTSEEQGSTLPKEYELSCELRTISGVHDEAACDEIHRAIGTAFDAVPTPTPLTLTASFAYYRIETQTGSEHDPGDTSSRARSYRVFATLL